MINATGLLDLVQKKWKVEREMEDNLRDRARQTDRRLEGKVMTDTQAGRQREGDRQRE